MHRRFRDVSDGRLHMCGRSASAAMIATGAVRWVTGLPAKRRVMALTPQVSRSFAGFTASLRF